MVSKEPPVPAPPPAKPHHLQDFKVKAAFGKVMMEIRWYGRGCGFVVASYLSRTSGTIFNSVSMDIACRIKKRINTY